MVFSFFGLPGISWDRIDARMTAEFPAVPLIEAAELAELYGTQVQPVVIDVRADEEFVVSRLPEALHLENAGEVVTLLEEKNTPIVVYCAVGFRSAAMAQELTDLGYSNVRNLKHSIFAWADAGRPLFNGKGKTTKVHPYNQRWGRLVSRALHAYQP
ncbi:MAG: rhodanese-like domain-containing protein [Gammaproteobacteria bacterium]|nr:rhodanese-like domain-containing protein [Gammaproteobacteria bacterium]MCY4358112.1 rhodanese-like domain-containing protein [Gammaproteobacteria bacterium]